LTGHPGATVELVEIARQLRADVSGLRFAAPVALVYNPLEYAWTLHREYLKRYGAGHPQVVLVGMNPGPFGMVQTGVPFGDVTMVRDWLRLAGPVGKPPREHAARPVQGFDCARREVSGQRLWGWAQRRFGTPEQFFARYFVTNYCPLCFLEAGGRNRTPDKLPADERARLFAACDRALRRTVERLNPRFVVGVGRFAASRAAAAAGDLAVRTGGAPHPSPANPAANRGWEREFTAALKALGIAPA
jgi:single-strand selective monofunctional uracil DNA glycosylase